MKHWANVGRLITDFDIAPDGKRAVFSARGDVFTVPAKEGSIRNLTRTPGIREQKVSWSPDGRWIAYISDRTGEDEIYIAPQDGLGKEQQITSGYKGFKFPPAWSPDSKKIAWADKDLSCGGPTSVTRSRSRSTTANYAEITNYSWSPDSKWLAYDKQSDNNYAVVYLYSLADAKITPITTALNNSYNAIFDPEGKYLYYLSDRDFNEVLGNMDFEFANPKTTRVYIVTLKKDEPSPLGCRAMRPKVKKTRAGANSAEEARRTANRSQRRQGKDESRRRRRR